MGYEGRMLEELVNSEKDPSIFTHAVCAEYLWDKQYKNYVECRRLIINKQKNSISNKKFKQLLEELAD